MKVIDLINKIANGEELPKKIRYDGDIYTYYEKGKDYVNDEDDNFSIFQDMVISRMLNDEVKIIAEPKKIEPIEKVTFSDKESAEMNILFMSKINEIIDFLNKEK